MSSTAKRDNNFTPKQLRGLDLLGKSLMKKYDFIYDFSLASDWEKWHSIIYVDLFVNPEKLSKFMGLPIDEYYQIKLDDGETLKYSLAHTILSAGESGSPERERNFEKSYNLKRDIENFLNKMYENLPDEMKINWVGEYGTYLCDIKIDNYISKK